MRIFAFLLISLIFSQFTNAQNSGHVNAEAVFLRAQTASKQDLSMFGSIDNVKPTSSLQKLGKSEVSARRMLGIASFDYDDDGRDDIVTYGKNNSQTYVNTIWVYDVIGNHSFNNNFTKKITLSKSIISGLLQWEYDINGVTTGDFDGDSRKDDIAVIARPTSSSNNQNNFRSIIILVYNEATEQFELKAERHESGSYSYLGITSGDFITISNENIDDIAVIRSLGGSNPDLINRVLIYPISDVSTYLIQYPRYLTPLNYDIRNIDTNESYNATSNAHTNFRPNAIVGGNFDTSNSTDEIALIVRNETSSNIDDYHKILIIGDFGSSNPNASFSSTDVLLPYSYRKATHAIAAEDFDDDGVDDILVYGTNGNGSGDRLDTGINSKMFLYTSDGDKNLTHQKTITYTASNVLAVAAGRFSRPEYANIKDDGDDYFPLWWYTSVYSPIEGTGL